MCVCVCACVCVCVCNNCAYCVASPSAVSAPAISVNATQQEASLTCACNALPLPTLSALMYPQTLNNSNLSTANSTSPIAAAAATLTSKQVVTRDDGSFTLTHVYSIPLLLELHSHAFTCQCAAAASAAAESNLMFTPPALLLFNSALQLFSISCSVSVLLLSKFHTRLNFTLMCFVPLSNSSESSSVRLFTCIEYADGTGGGQHNYSHARRDRSNRLCGGDVAHSGSIVLVRHWKQHCMKTS